MHVAALFILDGAALAGASDRDPADLLTAALEPRLHLVPRLRQVLYVPRLHSGSPVWVDDPGFDIRRHVRTRAVPPPADETALLTLCAELNEARLDRSRPLWEMWLLTGLPSGRAGLLIQLHHAVADGTAALAMIGALFDGDVRAPARDAPPWAPAPPPGGRELLAGALHRQGESLSAVVSRLRRPAVAAGRLVAVIRLAGQLAAEGRAPRTSLNVPVGSHRRLLLVRADLERARAAAHASGGTVNDLVLAAVSGGARRLLAARGELSPALVLRASVPVSLRDRGDHRVIGNRVGVMIMPLPVGEPGAARRLAQIARATAERKRQPPFQPSGRVLQRWMVRAMKHQRQVNLLVSNLPGPPAPLFLAGARVLEIFQVGVVQGNVTISVGVLSYAGQLNFDIVGDRDAVPDLVVFAAGMAEALDDLGALAAALA